MNEEPNIIDDGSQVEDNVSLNAEESPPDVAETKLEATDQEGQGGGKRQRSDAEKERSRKRYAELYYERNAANERAAALQARLDEQEQELRRLRNGSGDSASSADVDEEAALLKQRRAAWDDPSTDFSKIDEINDRLMEVRLNKRDMQRSQRPEANQQWVPPQGNPQQIHPAAQSWLEKNAWYTDPNNAHLAGEALRIHEELRSRYHYPIGEDLYQELDRRLRDLPEFDYLYQPQGNNGYGYGQEPNRQPSPQSSQPRSVVAPPSRGGVTPGQGNQAVLTPHDRETFARYNLDPTDKKTVETYLKYKRLS